MDECFRLGRSGEGVGRLNDNSGRKVGGRLPKKGGARGIAAGLENHTGDGDLGVAAPSCELDAEKPGSTRPRGRYV